MQIKREIDSENTDADGNKFFTLSFSQYAEITSGTTFTMVNSGYKFNRKIVEDLPKSGLGFQKVFSITLPDDCPTQLLLEWPK